MSVLLEIKNLKKIFYKNKMSFTAVDNVSFHLEKGECLGLAGESGCGKSTMAKMIAGLMRPDSGEILLDERYRYGSHKSDKTPGVKRSMRCLRENGGLSRRGLRELYADVQMVFQDSQASFDPRRKLGDGIMESLINHGASRADAGKRLRELLKLVELDAKLADRYPHQVSGGQCQRAAIARALAIKPKLVICDEATSALDVTVQAQIVELLWRLQEEMGLSLLLISHDPALLQHMCRRILIMHQGRVAESKIF